MMINWAVESEMPVHALLTKSDKLKRGAAKNTLFAFEKHIRAAGVDDLVTGQTFSAHNGDGLEGLRSKISEWLYCDPQNSDDVKSDTDTGE